MAAMITQVAFDLITQFLYMDLCKTVSPKEGVG